VDLSKKDICDIIRACNANGVVQLKLGDMSLSFEKEKEKEVIVTQADLGLHDLGVMTNKPDIPNEEHDEFTKAIDDSHSLFAQQVNNALDFEESINV
jgi:hypothetical protein